MPAQGWEGGACRDGVKGGACREGGDGRCRLAGVWREGAGREGVRGVAGRCGGGRKGCAWPGCRNPHPCTLRSHHRAHRPTTPPAIPLLCPGVLAGIARVHGEYYAVFDNSRSIGLLGDEHFEFRGKANQVCAVACMGGVLCGCERCDV